MLNLMSAQRKKYERGLGGCEEKPENVTAVFLKDRSQEQTVTVVFKRLFICLLCQSQGYHV